MIEFHIRVSEGVDSRNVEAWLDTLAFESIAQSAEAELGEKTDDHP